MTVTGTAGKIIADRQEVQAYLRKTAPAIEGYEAGWNVKYTTELTDQVWFYLRGEEYSAQLDHFVRRVADPGLDATNDFTSAAATDRVIELLTIDAAAGPATLSTADAPPVHEPVRRRSLLGRRS
jgi:hypothetical protein